MVRNFGLNLRKFRAEDSGGTLGNTMISSYHTHGHSRYASAGAALAKHPLLQAAGNLIDRDW